MKHFKEKTDRSPVVQGKVRAFFYYWFLVFVFFPYLQVFPTGTDMQPFAMLSAIMLFPLLRSRFLWVEVWFLLLLLLALLLFFIGDINFLALRSLLNYVSLFFIAYASRKVLKSGRVNFDLFFFLAFSIWFFVSLFQAVFDAHFLTFLISDSRTTNDRGVTGLAPEPTFLGVVYVFFIVISLHLEKLKYRNIIICLSLFGIVFLAKSSMALLFLILMFGFFLLTHVGIKSISFGLVAFFSLAYIIDFLEGSRIYRIYELAKNEPSSMLLVDASINDRFFHVFFSLKGFFENLLLPHGFTSWLPYVSDQLVEFQDIVIVEWFSLGGRIMSGYGAALFELGAFALIIPLVLTYLLFEIYRGDIKRFVFFSLFVNTIMFSAIPVGFPFFAFYIGFLGFLYSNKKQRFGKV